MHGDSDKLARQLKMTKDRTNAVYANVNKERTICNRVVHTINDLRKERNILKESLRAINESIKDQKVKIEKLIETSFNALSEAESIHQQIDEIHVTMDNESNRFEGHCKVIAQESAVLDAELRASTINNRNNLVYLKMQSEEVMQTKIDTVLKKINDLKKKKLREAVKFAANAINGAQTNEIVQSFEETMSEIRSITNTNDMTELISHVTSLESNNGIQFNKVHHLSTEIEDLTKQIRNTNDQITLFKERGFNKEDEFMETAVLHLKSRYERHVSKISLFEGKKEMVRGCSLLLCLSIPFSVVSPLLFPLLS